VAFSVAAQSLIVAALAALPALASVLKAVPEAPAVQAALQAHPDVVPCTPRVLLPQVLHKAHVQEWERALALVRGLALASVPVWVAQVVRVE
jgi:hypothetical protein